MFGLKEVSLFRTRVGDGKSGMIRMESLSHHEI